MAKMNIEKSRKTEIISLHNEISGLLKMSLEKAIRIGELLTEQKASLNHGEFGKWIKDNLPFTDRTARSYMSFYRNQDLIKSESVSDLTGAYKLLQPTEPIEQKGLLRQLQDLAEKELYTEAEAGGAMNDMDKMLTPTEEYSIVGTADDYVVFHIERLRKSSGYVLKKCNLNKPGTKPGHTEKQFQIKDNDFWWYLYKHVGINKIRAIWREPEIFLTEEEEKRIDSAGENLWNVVDEIREKHNQENLNDKNFIKFAQDMYRNFMDAYCRLCEAYNSIYGVA